MYKVCVVPNCGQIVKTVSFSDRTRSTIPFFSVHTNRKVHTSTPLHIIIAGCRVGEEALREQLTMRKWDNMERKRLDTRAQSRSTPENLPR